VDVTFKRPPPENLRIVEVGPYVIMSAPDGEKLGDYVNFSPSQMWALRGPSIKASPLTLVTAAILPLILALAFTFGLKVKPSVDFPKNNFRLDAI
jgi:hypothetical protein